MRHRTLTHHTGLLAVLLLVALVAGCNRQPSDLAMAMDAERAAATDSAREVLELATDAAARGDFDALCRLAASELMCRTELSGLEEAAPSTPPTVECVEFVSPVDSRSGGVNLILSGVDRAGAPYRSDFLVIDTGDGWRTQMPVFWAGIGLAGRNQITPPGSEPAGCGE